VGEIDMPTRKLALTVTGKRKTAVSRAVIKPGSGKVKVNKVPLEIYTPGIARYKMSEPLMLAGDLTKQIDVEVTVHGGGFMGQAEAVRTSIARGLVNWFKSSRIRRIFITHDRSMLAGDSRRKEMKKFGGVGARRRRQKVVSFHHSVGLHHNQHSDETVSPLVPCTVRNDLWQHPQRQCEVS